MVLFPSNRGNVASYSALPTYQSAAQSSAGPAPAAQNVNVAQPAAAAAARRASVPAPSAPTVRAAPAPAPVPIPGAPTHQFQTSAPRRKSPLAKTSPGNLVALILWLISALVSCMVLLIPGRITHNFTYDCPNADDDQAFVRITCKPRTYYMLLWFAISMAGLVDWGRRHYITNNTGQHSRGYWQFVVAIGPVVMTGITIAVFAVAVDGMKCFKGCVAY